MKKVVWIIICILIVILIVFIGRNIIKSVSDNMTYYESVEYYNKLAKIDEEKYLKQAEENATLYIQKKYGFTPNFINKAAEYTISSEGEGVIRFNTRYDYTGNVLLKFEKDNKEYDVFISGATNTTIGYDNYQYEEIKSKLVEEFYSLFQMDFYNSEIEYGKYSSLLRDEANNMINPYYDGENIKNIVQNYRILLEYGENVNLDNFKLSFLEKDGRILILKYKSLEDFEQGKKDCDNEKYVGSITISGFSIDQRKLIHIDEYFVLDDGVKKIQKIDYIEYENVNTITYSSDKPTKISISKSDSVIESSYAKEHDILSDVYNLDFKKSSDYISDDIILFFPIDSLKNISKYKENNWEDNFAILMQGKDDKTQEIITKRLNYGGQLIHYENKEYFMIEFSRIEMNYNSDIKFVLIGQPKKEETTGNRKSVVFY